MMSTKPRIEGTKSALTEVVEAEEIVMIVASMNFNQEGDGVVVLIP